MNVLITGGAGFLGSKLAQALLSRRDIDSIVLADVAIGSMGCVDIRLQGVQCDLTDSAAVYPLVRNADLIFHLAAVVSGKAESDFDLGMRVNVEGTRLLLEAARAHSRFPVVVFTSSLAVFGPPLPDIIHDETPLHPRSSYGMEKAVGELLVADYSRRGYVDGRVVRLPTVCVRPGVANAAASSFVSGIIREPLNGQIAVCPVDPSLELWLSSPKTIVNNLIHAAGLPKASLGDWPVVNAPGITVSVAGMCESLRRIAGQAVVDRITFKDDPVVRRIVSSWPSRFDLSRAMNLGFACDGSFDDLVIQHLASGAGSPG